MEEYINTALLLIERLANNPNGILRSNIITELANLMLKIKEEHENATEELKKKILVLEEKIKDTNSIKMEGD